MVLRCGPLRAVAEHLFTARELELRSREPQDHAVVGADGEWAAVAAEMRVPRDRLLLVRQVHRAGAAVVRRGRGGVWTTPEADILASDDPSSAIGVRAADCAPILIADRRQPVVAAAHAGWRGTVQGAAGQAVDRLVGEFGSDPRDLVAAIGPCLGPCCGEVGDEVPAAFRAAGHGEAALARWFSAGPSGRARLNLWRANADQLAWRGLPEAQIHVAALCTRTFAQIFHSHRASGERAGRMAAVIRPRA